MSIKRWDAKGRTHEASQGGFVRYGDHVAEVAERDGQVQDMERVIAMQRADVKRLTADLAAARAQRDNAEADAGKLQAEVYRLRDDLTTTRAERDGLAKALHELAEYADASIGSQYGTLRASLVRDIVHEALAALPPKEHDDA